MLDAFEGVRSFLDTCGEITARRKTWPCGQIIVEDKANGPACESVFRHRWPGVIKLVSPLGSKVARLAATSPEWSEGRVHLVETAPYFESIRSTLTKFPRVRRDDSVDAASQALMYLKSEGGWLGKLKRL